MDNNIKKKILNEVTNVIGGLQSKTDNGYLYWSQGINDSVENEDGSKKDHGEQEHRGRFSVLMKINIKSGGALTDGRSRLRSFYILADGQGGRAAFAE